MPATTSNNEHAPQTERHQRSHDNLARNVVGLRVQAGDPLEHVERAVCAFEAFIARAITAVAPAFARAGNNLPRYVADEVAGA